jgi:hypothetical protein
MAKILGNNAGGRAQTANRAAMRRLQEAHLDEFTTYLYEERIKVGLPREPQNAYQSVRNELDRERARNQRLEQRIEQLEQVLNA